MSKYNLSELLTEVAGGRIGTLNISARDLVNKMEDLEDKGVRVERFDGLSADGKTYIEFHVHPIRKYDEDYSFSVYDFKFGFDPMSPEHADEEYSFSVGGRPSALENAETTLRGGDMGYQINEDEFDEARQSAIESSQEAAGIKEEEEPIKEEKYISKAELKFQLKQYRDGMIDGDDLANAFEEIIYGRVTPPGYDFEQEEFTAIPEEDSMKEVMGVDRKGNKKPDTDGSDATKFKKAAMSEEEMGDDEKKYTDTVAKMLKDRILKDIPMDVIVDFVKTHGSDIRRMNNSEIKNEFEEFRSVNYDYINEEDSMESREKFLRGFRERDLYNKIYSPLRQDANATVEEINAYFDSLIRSGDEFDDVDDYVEDFKNYIADKALQEHFNRFK